VRGMVGEYKLGEELKRLRDMPRVRKAREMSLAVFRTLSLLCSDFSSSLLKNSLNKYPVPNAVRGR
jgi:hypothetical protein